MQLSRLLTTFLLTVILFSLTPTRLFALYDPLSQPNNRFGIHILDPHELNLATELINSSGGDWGYVTVVIRSDDRNQKKWQDFFTQARAHHVIPIVRLATKTQNDYWIKPEEGDAKAWADFFGSLYWPTNNHYIIVYNEPNHAKEWGNLIDPEGYAKELAKTIDAVKAQDPDAYLLNAGFDAAAPTIDGQMLDEVSFLQRMDKAVPGIFHKINGWSSHSYPQPNFSGSPTDSGRNTVATYRWEEQLLKESFNVDTIPIFITETGWVHADGLHPNTSYLSENQIADNFKTAYTTVWTDHNLVAVTPFTLSYDQAPFDHFSWSRSPQLKSPDVLATQTNLPQFNQFETTKALAKGSGTPHQKVHGLVTSFTLPNVTEKNAFIKGEIVIKNIGEKTWFSTNHVAALAVRTNDKTITTDFAVNQTIPGDSIAIPVTLLTPAIADIYEVSLQIKDSSNEVITIPYQLTVGSPKKRATLVSLLKQLSVKLFS